MKYKSPILIVLGLWFKLKKNYTVKVKVTVIYF